MREARVTAGEGLGVMVIKVLKNIVTTIAAEMAGYRQLLGRSEGSTCWASEIDKAVRGKRTCDKMFQKDVLEKIQIKKVVLVLKREGNNTRK